MTALLTLPDALYVPTTTLPQCTTISARSVRNALVTVSPLTVLIVADHTVPRRECVPTIALGSPPLPSHQARTRAARSMSVFKMALLVCSFACLYTNPFPPAFPFSFEPLYAY
jgi:hypothetical protein